jgi:hypothetical protein
MNTVSNIAKKVSLALFTLALIPACTSEFIDMNTNPVGLTDEQANADFTLVSAFLQQAQRSIIPQDVGTYQLAENLTSDSYSGYMGAQAPFRSNSNNLTYELVDGWNHTIWTDRYINVMNPTYKVIELAKTNPVYKDLEALAKVVRVSAMSRVSDKIGPVIYSKYNISEDDGAILYDAQKDVYPMFFADLESAIATLKELKASPVSAQMLKADLVYTANNYDNWLRVANTLRLRLALRISKVAPEIAKTQGEAALNPANGGLLELNSQNCLVTTSVDHPLNIIGSPTQWSDTRMGAPMESIMGGYDDPRLGKYFVPAKDPAVVGQFKGIRSGIDIDGKARYNEYSELVNLPQKMQIMIAPESWFLKAEAALRGWAGAGDAQTNYETGILRSFEMYGIQAQAAAYMADSTKKPKPYIDPKARTAGQNDILEGSPHLSTITIKWDESATPDRKLERIITQKWIALFPDGEESWAEYRRTGYPILFPVVVNLSAGLIPTIPGVRRLPIPVREYNTNARGAKEGEATLGGPNTGPTRLWWDLDNKSF